MTENEATAIVRDVWQERSISLSVGSDKSSTLSEYLLAYFKKTQTDAHVCHCLVVFE